MPNAHEHAAASTHQPTESSNTAARQARNRAGGSLRAGLVDTQGSRRPRVRLPKEAPSGTTIPLRVLAKFQACSDAGVCLMPAEWSGEVSVSVKP